jgi:hypothetical protein
MFDALLFMGRIVFIEDSGGSTRDFGRMTGKPSLTRLWPFGRARNGRFADHPGVAPSQARKERFL